MMRLMLCRSTITGALALFLFLAIPAQAQTPQRQTQEDDYTRYELLAPDTAQFRILYEVTATTPGARFFFNAIRKGSIASDERVVRHDDRSAAEVGGRERRAGAGGRSSDGRSRDRMAQGASGAARTEGRRGPRPDRQDLQGCEELLPRRRHDRVRSLTRHPPKRRGAAARLSPGQLQRAVAGHDDP